MQATEESIEQLVQTIGKDTVAIHKDDIYGGTYYVSIHASGDSVKDCLKDHNLDYLTFVRQLKSYCSFVEKVVPKRVILCGDFNAILRIVNNTLFCFDKEGAEMFSHTFTRPFSLSKSVVATTHKTRIITTQINKIGDTNSFEIDYILTNNFAGITKTGTYSGKVEIVTNKHQSISSPLDHYSVHCEIDGKKVKTLNLCGESSVYDENGNQVVTNIFEFIPEEILELFHQRGISSEYFMNKIKEIGKTTLSNSKVINKSYAKVLRPSPTASYLDIFNVHMLPVSLSDLLVQNDFFHDQQTRYDTLFEQFKTRANAEILSHGEEIFRFLNALYTDPELQPIFVEWFNLASTIVKTNPIDEMIETLEEFDVVALQEVTANDVKKLLSMEIPEYDIHVGPFFPKLNKKTGLLEYDTDGNIIMYKTCGVLIVKK